MKVKELRDKLSEYPDDLNVYLFSKTLPFDKLPICDVENIDTTNQNESSIIVLKDHLNFDLNYDS